MWFLRLSLKLFLVYAALNLSLAIAYVTVVAKWHRKVVMDQVEEGLHDTAVVLQSHVSDLLANRDRDNLQQLAEELAPRTAVRRTDMPPTPIRITLVDGRGVVLADSDEDPVDMENHYNRPELKEARTNGYGTALRYSTTLKKKMFYLALPVERTGPNENLVRVALPLESIEQQIATLHKFLWISAILVGFVALALTVIFAGRIMKPLSQLTDAAESVAAGNYDQNIPAGGRDELGTLGRAVNDMRQALTRQMSELRDNSQRLETVLSSMVEGVLAVNADQRVLFANEASKSLLGIEIQEVVGRPLLEVTRHLAVREAALAAMNAEVPHRSDFETIGGNRRHLAVRATRLPGDPCSGAVIVLYDITDLRRLEDIRREFVANVSHELKTPLSSIKAYAETLRLGAINDNEHNLGFVERIEEQAERLHQLILDLLHLARVEAGKEAFDIKEVSLVGAIERRASVYLQRVEAEHLRLEIETPETPVLAKADEEGVFTILDNLFNNAIQYTPEGGQVTVRCRVDEDLAVLEVEDTGIGIAPDDQQRVFERFYRVDKARSRELGGTGLGLAIVKHLTQSFGGEVGLTSELGSGSTFRVRLPRYSEHDE